jgi:hypothetical protein
MYTESVQKGTTKMPTPLHRLHAAKDAIREPFCFPGGYSKVVYLTEGPICITCAHETWCDLVRSTLFHDDGWSVAGVGVYWEGPAAHCVSCSREMPSEYGNPDEEN